MVVALKPGKFYGSSLPRPRYYTDVKLSDERVDPPVPVLDPLLSWANEAHWSMGGLSFSRLRLQGRIEGNILKLKKEKEKKMKMIQSSSSTTPVSLSSSSKKKKKSSSPPPPGAILKKKQKKRKARSWFVDEDDEEEEREDDGGGVRRKRRLVRKLGDDFEMVARSENEGSQRNGGGGVSEEGVALRTRSRRKMVLLEQDLEEDSEFVVKGSVSVSPNGTRTSPRLKQK